VPAGHGNGQAQRASGTDLLLEFEIVESRRKRDAVPRLGGLDRARKAGEGSLLGLAFVGIAAGSDVDEPVHGGERKTNGASGQGLIVTRSRLGSSTIRLKSASLNRRDNFPISLEAPIRATSGDPNARE